MKGAVNPTDATTADRLIHMAEVCSQVGLSKSRVYELIAAGRFPRARKVEGRTVWRQSHVQAWIDNAWTAAPEVGSNMGSVAA